jgi:hypothetical protein
MTTMTTSIATTILEQLGGNKFRVMTGAKGFMGEANSLSFKLPARFAKDGINFVRITLDASDTYSVAFAKGTKVLASFEGIYAEDLTALFTRTTGLFTYL